MRPVTKSRKLPNPPLPHRLRQPTILVELLREWEGWPVLLEQARELNWRILYLNFRGGDIPRDFNLQGALVDLFPDHPMVRSLIKLGCPVVRIGGAPHPDDGVLPVVMPDWQAIGRLAARHFQERRFQHVGYIGRKPWGLRRVFYEAFRNAAAAAGLTCHLLQLDSRAAVRLSHTERYIFFRKELAAWLGTLPKPMGLLAYDDLWAAALCSMCADLRIAVPEEVAVLGIGNNQLTCLHTQVPLSSIQLDDERTIKTAVRMLRQRMRNQRPAQTLVLIPPRGLVVRESTDALATTVPHVAAALRYLRQNLQRNLSVPEVAEAVGVSLRTLERGFQDALGRGVSAELQRRRLEELCRLLRTTDLPVAEAGPRAGFLTASHLNRSFRRAFGLTPRQFRQQNPR